LKSVNVKRTLEMSNEAMLAKIRKNRFLVVGRAGLDLYADPPGTEIETAAGFTAALGGSAANIAVAITRQGGSTALLTTLSNDAVGRYVLNALSHYKVDTSLVRIVAGEVRTSLAVVETRAENCQSVIYRNGAADFQLEATTLDQQAMNDFAAVIVTGTALAMQPSRSSTLQVMTMARELGLPLIIDIDYRPYSWSSKAEAQRICAEAISLCDVIVGNDEEFAVLAGSENGLSYAETLAHNSERIVLYKKGQHGCTTFLGGSHFETPVFKVTALKPTGAGDAFMGGLMSSLVQGSTLPHAVRRGAATAAIVVTRVGCAPAMPNAAEVDEFIRHALN
jgi:5-dehydro-2-deoxygluconokinase